MSQRAPSPWFGLCFGLVSGVLVCAGPVFEWLHTPDSPPKAGQSFLVALRAKAGAVAPQTNATAAPSSRKAPAARPGPKAASPSGASSSSRTTSVPAAASTTPGAPSPRAPSPPRSPPRLRQIPRGQVLLGPGEAVTPKLVPIIEAAFAASPRESPAGLAARLGLLLATIVLLAVLGRRLVRNAPRPGARWALLVLVPGVSAASVHFLVLFSPLPPGLAPSALAAVACGLVMGRNASLLAAAASLVLVGVSQAAGPEQVWALGAGALASGLVAAPRRVILLVPAGLVGALVQGGLLAASSPPPPLGSGWPTELVLGLSAAGPLGAAILTLGLAWPLLRLAGTASARRLRRTTRLHHPLLAELRRRAPGTFRHSANVSRLAEAGGRALGADVRLLRAAALYHDVGKLAGPRYFAENVGEGPDPHLDLTPEESARRLRRHVRDGLDLARRYGLPRELWAGIAEHHGTALLGAPAARARAEGAHLDPAIYHYPGPLPRSRESAILMVADAVEGASRGLLDPSLAELSALVEKVVERLMNEYQFEDCELGQVDLVTLEEALVHDLRHSLHRRRVHPAQPVAPPRSGAEREDEP